MAKWIIGIIIVVLLAGALWYSGVLGNLSMTPSQTPTSTPETASTTQQAAVPQPENGMAATNDASDAAIAQDTAAIDAQMQGLSTDNSNVDSSMNDKQTVQSY
jgi:hypothetical protein